MMTSSQRAIERLDVGAASRRLLVALVMSAVVVACGGGGAGDDNEGATGVPPAAESFDPTNLSQLRALAESEGFVCRGSDAAPAEPSQLPQGGEGWTCTDSAGTMLLFLFAGEGVDGRASLESEGCPGRGFFWGGPGFEVDLLYKTGASGEAAQAFGEKLGRENLICSQL
jgi:hypothetical protein